MLLYKFAIHFPECFANRDWFSQEHGRSVHLSWWRLWQGLLPRLSIGGNRGFFCHPSMSSLP